jgi:hypothetical protein
MKLQRYRLINTTTTAIRLVVRLPLRGADRVMILFKSVPLPVYSEILGRHVQIEPETLYLAVTENGQYYSLLTTADLQKCQLGLFAICEATFPFIHKTRASCSSAFYFGQVEFAHQNCRKIILRENFNPVWLHVKGIHPFWIYSLPSTIVVTKSCKTNRTTQSSTLTLSNTGTLTEDTHCQFYSEDFVLLPVSNGYTNVTITGSQVFLPHLPELMSPEENHQIQYDEARTHRTLASLENIARRNSPTKQQSYIELRELLATISSEETATNQFTWVYTLIILSIVLSFIALTSRYCQRSLLTMIHGIFPCPIKQRPSTDLEMTQLALHPLVTDPATTDCPCRTSSSDEPTGITTSHPAIPLKLEAEAVAKPNQVAQPRPVERACFARPGRFQLRT